MIRSAGGKRWPYLVFYTGLLAMAFLFSAWKALTDGDLEIAGLNRMYKSDLIIEDCFPDDFKSLVTSADVIPTQANSGSLSPGGKYKKSITTKESLSGNQLPATCQNYPELDVFPGSIDIPVKKNKRVGSFRQKRELGTPFLLGDCENAIRIHCSQTVSGNNFGPDTTSFRIGDCAPGGTTDRYRGPVWYRLSGTGGFFTLRASSSGSTADIQVYRGSISSGECDSLICIGGVWNIHTGEKTVSFFSQIGREYFVMLANLANSTSTNNMSYSLSMDCPCTGSDLVYAPPNHFSSPGTFVIRADSSSTITASNQIFSGASVTFATGKEILLHPTFEVKSGGSFIATIRDCDEMLRLVPQFGLMDREEIPLRKEESSPPLIPGNIPREILFRRYIDRD